MAARDSDTRDVSEGDTLRGGTAFLQSSLGGSAMSVGWRGVSAEMIGEVVKLGHCCGCSYKVDLYVNSPRVSAGWVCPCSFSKGFQCKHLQGLYACKLFLLVGSLFQELQRAMMLITYTVKAGRFWFMGMTSRSI